MRIGITSRIKQGSKGLQSPGGVWARAFGGCNSGIGQILTRRIRNLLDLDTNTFQETSAQLCYDCKRT
jgi:hypothetical protein